MKNSKKILTNIVLLTSFVLTGCNTGEGVNDNNKNTISVNDAIELINSLEGVGYYKDEVSIKGYVLDFPTKKNSEGKFSFLLTDDLDNPTNSIPVFLASYNGTVNKYDEVVVTSYVRSFFMGSEKKPDLRSYIVCGQKDGYYNWGNCVVSNVVSNPKNKEISGSKTNFTMLDVSTYLIGQEENYPISDSYIEQYQQASGGYIANAKKAGIEIDKMKHSPNQKWHYFESWFLPSLLDGTHTFASDAKARSYSALQCPELLLWIYEAMGCPTSKVEAAKQVAIDGKVAGTASATLGKNIRNAVSWEEDLLPALK